MKKRISLSGSYRRNVNKSIKNESDLILVGSFSVYGILCLSERILFSMKKMISELKRRPLLYGTALFPILAAFFAGGMTALALSAVGKEQVTGFFYQGDKYWQVVRSVLFKRLVLLMIQAFFSIWIMGFPISTAAGICMQISWSLPCFALIRNLWQGIFLVFLTLPLSACHIFMGMYCFSVSLEYLAHLFRTMRLRKSSEDILREGWIPMRKIGMTGVFYVLSVFPEVFICMNIAVAWGI